MDKLTLGSLIKQQVADALSYGSSRREHAQKSLKYYRGDPFGDEDPDQSKYVSRDLAETVDSLLPSLMRVFFSGDMFGKFEPKGAEDEAGAKQATDLCNHVFQDQNEGFKIGYVAMKDALLEDTGIVEVCWDGTPEITRERYRGLDDNELAVLEADENIEIGEKETQALDMIGPQGPTKINLHNVSVTRTNKMGKCAVFNVPPEEFFIERGAVSLDTALICGRQYHTTASDLLNEGFSQKDIDDAGSTDDPDHSGEKSTRFGEEDFDRTETSVDESTRRIIRTDAYVRVDYDDDGIAELRKVVCLGTGYVVVTQKTQLGIGEKPREPEEIDLAPYATFQGMPSPHKFHGESMYDKVGDLQFLNSTLWRQTLNSAYLTTAPRMFAKGKVDIEALLAVRPNGIVQGGPDSEVTPLVVPFVGKESLPLIEMVKAAREERSGVTRYNQGLDADSLNKTATGVSIIQSAAEQKQELIARCFAEGFRRLYKLILKNLCQHQAKPLALRVRNKWEQMDPRSWKESWDFAVSVGLGTGNKVQRAQQAMMLLQVQREAIAGGKAHMVTDENVYNGITELVRALDMKPAESFVTDPKQAGQQPQQPPVDPLALEVQLKYQQLMKKDQMDHEYRMVQVEKEHQVKMRSAEMDAGVKGFKAVEDVKVDQFKAKADVEIKREVAGSDAALRRDVATSDDEIKRIGMDNDTKLKFDGHESDKRLKQDAHETDKQVKKDTAAMSNRVKAEGAGIQVKVAGGADVGKIEERLEEVAEQQNETAKMMMELMKELKSAMRPKRAVKRNGGWEQEYVQ